MSRRSPNERPAGSLLQGREAAVRSSLEPHRRVTELVGSTSPYP
ncbi:hypothetical protein [Pyxidicoccus trucidator]|nr:hypothetical protein [Pyxidicoccus trucidator]